MTKLFISHSSKDNEFALKLAEQLIEKGFEVWIDKSDIRAGKIWWDEVQRGLDEGDAMILVISQDAMDLRNVADEWGYYLDEEKPIVPVHWLPAKVHFRLRGLQYVNFRDAEFAGAFEHLCSELERNGFALSDSNGQMHVIGSADARPVSVNVAKLLSPLYRAKIEALLPDPFEWVEIPGGKVTLEDESDKNGTKGGVYDVPAFTISKYPITNAQFQMFVKAPMGYDNAAWWEFSEAAKQWHKQNGKPKSPAFPGDDHPRTNVCWFEAVAFCRWLTAQSAPDGSVSPTRVQTMLPTEEQWQRAAVGDTGWIYPWGNRFDSAKCNTSEGGIRLTTPVTQYPQGSSPYGVMDMSGNVWEWCLNEWNTGDPSLEVLAHLRVIRGGAWGDNSLFARALNRARSNPDAQSYGFGFRVVVNID